MPSDFLLDYVRITLSLVMLFVASLLDFKKREVHDGVWIVFGGIAVLLLVFETDYLGVLFSSILIPASLLLWRMGLFGGADAFALCVLSILAPMLTIDQSVLVSPFTTLTNAALLSILPMLHNLGKNIFLIMVKKKRIFYGFEESTHKKMVAMLLGFKSEKPKYSFCIERTEKGNVKKFDFALHHADDAEFCEVANSWVTPGIPFLIYITGGFVIQLFYGDIILKVLDNIISL